MRTIEDLNRMNSVRSVLHIDSSHAQEFEKYALYFTGSKFHHPLWKVLNSTYRINDFSCSEFLNKDKGYVYGWFGVENGALTFIISKEREIKGGVMIVPAKYNRPALFLETGRSNILSPTQISLGSLFYQKKTPFSIVIASVFSISVMLTDKNELFFTGKELNEILPYTFKT